MLRARLARLRLVCAPSCGGRGSLVASLGGASERLEGLNHADDFSLTTSGRKFSCISTPNSTCQDIRITVSDLLGLDLELDWNLCARTEDPAEPAALPRRTYSIIHTASIMVSPIARLVTRKSLEGKRRLRRVW